MQVTMFENRVLRIIMGPKRAIRDWRKVLFQKSEGKRKISRQT
jgi:hypothetical protein